MIHLHLPALPLAQNNIHQAVHRALPIPARLHLPVQHRHPHHHAPPLPFLPFVLPQDSPLPVELGLPVQVRRPRRGARLVGRLAGPPGVDVVGRDVDEEDAARRAELRQRARGFDVEGAGAGRVGVDFVGEAVRGACPGGLLSVVKWGDGGRRGVQWITTCGLIAGDSGG